MKTRKIIAFSIATAMLSAGYAAGMDKRWDLPHGCSWNKEGKFFEIENPGFHGNDSIIDFLDSRKKPFFGIKLNANPVGSKFFNNIIERSSRLRSLSFIECKVAWNSVHYYEVKNLERLDVEGGGVPIDVLRVFITNNINLTSLRLINVCKDLNLDFSNLKSLKELFLEGVTLLPEETLDCILENNEDLKYIYLCNCEKISLKKAKTLGRRHNCVIEWYKGEKEIKKKKRCIIS